MITIQIPEEDYWPLVQAVSAAGTASHRHGMERHAERFHDAEKHLFRGYEQAGGVDDIVFTLDVYDDGTAIEQIGASTSSLGETIHQVLDTYPHREIHVYRKSFK